MGLHVHNTNLNTWYNLAHMIMLGISKKIEITMKFNYISTQNKVLKLKYKLNGTES